MSVTLLETFRQKIPDTFFATLPHPSSGMRRRSNRLREPQIGNAA